MSLNSHKHQLNAFIHSSTYGDGLNRQLILGQLSIYIYIYWRIQILKYVAFV